MIEGPDQQLARLRWGVYSILIAIAVGNMTGRILAVNSANNSEQHQRPFLSANDRSRWLTARALVEHGTFAIDDVVREPNWDTIDMVQHAGTDGEPHLYSSKPPLLATLVAGEYWLINRATGWTLGDHPYEIGRFMLLTINVLPLLLMYVLLAVLVERFGTTDWGRIYVMAAAALGTFLTTFAVTLNNHVIAAVSVAVALYAFVRIIADGERHWSYFAIAGLASAFVSADELPALSLLALMGALLLWHAPRETLVSFLPGALLVVAAFFATNYLSHNSFLPPYMHRSATDPSDNWYDYSYTLNGQEHQSYWRDRQGIDRGEPSQWTYALHVLVGHHGIFSLSPIWLLSLWGMLLWLGADDRTKRELALMTGALTMICLVFYIGFRPQIDRNYGGMTSGFRWIFWFVPLWIVVMLPAADRLANSRLGMAVALALLTLSVLSVSYPTWNPWTQPWIYHWLQWWGWQGV